MILTISDLRAKAGFFAILVLCGMVLCVLVTGWTLGTGGTIEALLLAAMTLAVWLQRRLDPVGIGAELAASAALACSVAFLVWLLRGHPWQPDAHMLFFAAFALTVVFCDWRPIVLFAGVIAVHHLVLNFLLTEAVFPGEASISRVLLHAAVLVAQAVPMIWVAGVLNRLFKMSQDNLDTAEQARRAADQARDAAEVAARRRTQEKQEVVGVVDALVAAFRNLARGDLSATLPGQVPPRFAVLPRQFDDMVGSIRCVVHQMEKSAGDLRDSADGLEAVARQNAVQANEHSDILNSALEQVQGMTKIAAETSEHVRLTGDRVTHGRAVAEEGGRILQSAVTVMQRMEANSTQIDSISKVMEAIAFQTNLLALNAGVEAARAGDAGRGFAVVATEVRALAQKAAEAAKHIRSLVTASQQSMAEGSQLVQQTSETLGALIRDTLDNAAAVGVISTMTQQQSASLGQLVACLQNMEQVARKSAQLAERSLRMSSALKEESHAMRGSTAGFRRSATDEPAERPLAAE